MKKRDTEKGAESSMKLAESYKAEQQSECWLSVFPDKAVQSVLISVLIIITLCFNIKPLMSQNQQAPAVTGSGRSGQIRLFARFGCKFDGTSQAKGGLWFSYVTAWDAQEVWLPPVCAVK